MNKEENKLEVSYTTDKEQRLLIEIEKLKKIIDNRYKENDNLKQTLNEIREFIDKVDGVMGERHKIIIKNKIDKVLGDDEE